MKTIAVSQLCVHYNISPDFIDSLSNFELIEVIEIETVKHIQVDDLSRIERLMRMHYDLNVNFEGLDIINNLLNQIDYLQKDVKLLQNKMNYYE